MPGVHRIALSQPEFAADDAIFRACISRNINALYEGARAFADDIGKVNCCGFRVARDPRLHFNKRLATRLQRIRNCSAAPFHRIAVIPIAIRNFDFAAQAFHTQARDFIDDLNLTDAIALAFINREGHEEGAAIRRQFAGRTRDLHIGKPLAQIEAAQQFPVIGQAFGIVDVA